MGSLSDADVKKMKVIELKAALSERNQPATGIKAVLARRLLEFIKNETALDNLAAVQSKAAQPGTIEILLEPSEIAATENTTEEAKELASMKPAETIEKETECEENNCKAEASVDQAVTPESKKRNNVEEKDESQALQHNMENETIPHANVTDKTGSNKDEEMEINENKTCDVIVNKLGESELCANKIIEKTVKTTESDTEKMENENKKMEEKKPDSISINNKNTDDKDTDTLAVMETDTPSVKDTDTTAVKDKTEIAEKQESIPEKVDSTSSKKQLEVIVAEKKTVNEYELKDLQRELKYEIFETWRQLNVVETYVDEADEGKMEYGEHYVEVKSEEARGLMSDFNMVQKRADLPTVCCSVCQKHLNEHVFHHHLFFAHNVKKRKCWHGVAVLANDKSHRAARLSGGFHKRFMTTEPQYNLFCNLCNVSFLLNFKGLDHSKTTKHKERVKSYVKQHSAIPDKYIKIVDNITYADEASKARLAPTLEHEVMYNPHELIADCCCRVIDCKYCQTSPFIFDRVTSLNSLLLCSVCSVTFKYQGFESVVLHVRSAGHKLWLFTNVKNTGLVLQDTEIIVALKS